MKKLIAFAAVVAGCYLFFAAAFVIVALAMDGRRDNQLATPAPSPGRTGNGVLGDDDWLIRFPLDDGADAGSLLRPPARTNFILMGIDNNNLADAIMVGTFYRDTGDIHLMSVPRDTLIRLSDTRRQQIQGMGLNMPRELKMNELRSWGGRDIGSRLIREEAGAMFGVHFHYYVEVNLNAFRRIVDNILGGIQFNVPRRLFYEDPLQNLLIDIPAGNQRLNGVQAEGLVRYREYADGDLGRNRMQIDFMNALIRQMVTREALMADPLELTRIIINEVNTNMTLASMLRYLRYTPPARPLGEIRSFVMPGTAGYHGPLSVFLPNINQLHGVADQVFRAQIVIPDPEADTDE